MIAALFWCEDSSTDDNTAINLDAQLRKLFDNMSKSQ